MPVGVEVRRATRDDVGDAARIISESLAGYGLPFEPDGRDADVALFGSRDDHDDLVAMMNESHVVVGVTSVGPHGDDGVAWISKVFVTKSARGAGIGRLLLRAAHEAARGRGYRRVGLRTRVVFKEAIALYESEGYQRVSADPARLEPRDGHDVVLVGAPPQTPRDGLRRCAPLHDVVYFRDLA